MMTLIIPLLLHCRSFFNENQQPHRNWEVDLEDLERQIDSNTSMIIVNNPSNPCGSVYSREHLQAILKVASRRRIPIVSDEIYDRLIFDTKSTFYSLGPLSIDVPILVVGGIAKVYLAPGWRLGWVIIHDRHKAFSAEVREMNE
jgi:tyrosine aminotransferase